MQNSLSSTVLEGKIKKSFSNFTWVFFSNFIRVFCFEIGPVAKKLWLYWFWHFPPNLCFSKIFPPAKGTEKSSETLRHAFSFDSGLKHLIFTKLEKVEMVKKVVHKASKSLNTGQNSIKKSFVFIAKLREKFIPATFFSKPSSFWHFELRKWQFLLKSSLN